MEIIKRIFLLMIIVMFGCNKTEKENSLKETIINSDDTLKNHKMADLSIQRFYEEGYLKEILKNGHHNFKPNEGVIPDSITAIKVAEIILSNIYSEKSIMEEKPFTALLKKGYWIVYGTLSEGYKGCVAEIVIKKDNGEVINISHGE